VEKSIRTRQAHARWEGDLGKGVGKVDFGRGLFSGPYSFASRFEDASGTNPEELLAAAHASCYLMALASTLSEAGFVPENLDVTAYLEISSQDGSFGIAASRLVCEARVDRIDATSFADYAELAKANCLVSTALTGIVITLEAKLREA
jgi:osmotically inducible protein OsmC